MRLPRSVVLIGEPTRIPFSNVARIVDRSVEGPGFKNSGAAVRALPEQAKLLDRDPVLAIELFRDEGEIYCLSYRSDIYFVDLVRLCEEDAIDIPGILVLFYSAGD